MNAEESSPPPRRLVAGLMIRLPRLVVGLVIITIGVLFALQNFGIIRVEEYIRYWPVLFIVVGAIKLFQAGGAPSRVGGVVWILIGTIWTLINTSVLHLRFRDIGPACLILLGGYLVWAALGVRASNVATEDASSTVSGLAFMGGLKRRVVSQDFRGGEVTAVMGGAEIDLRNASISGPSAVIEVFAWWGGVELRVPEDWVVIGKVLPLLGGFEDKTREPGGDVTMKKQLIVKGIAVMGGVEVKN